MERFSYHGQLCFFSIWECLCILFKDDRGIFWTMFAVLQSEVVTIEAHWQGWTGRDCEAVQRKQSHDSGGVVGVFFHCLKPWASWGVLRNVTTVVGVVVWEIQCCSYLACQEDLALHLTWPQGGLDAGLMGFGCRIHTFPAAKINDKCPRSWCQSLFGAPTAQ